MPGITLKSEIAITPTRLWQQGPLSTFIGAESKEVDPRFVIVGSVSTPVVHLNGDKAYV
ncbi:hypothetical protein [Lactiplantibacillus plantarum]|uniref:hypothetical protein n=1 Tax=Lactiplantibacillus plantarum TaxID=1590 RepID=UPI0020222EF0|nr:hypothetical protein [Lactiplantibacillus plantarum]